MQYPAFMTPRGGAPVSAAARPAIRPAGQADAIDNLIARLTTYPDATPAATAPVATTPTASDAGVLAALTPNPTLTTAPPATLPSGLPNGTVQQLGSSVTPALVAVAVGGVLVVGALAYYLTRTAPTATVVAPAAPARRSARPRSR